MHSPKKIPPEIAVAQAEAEQSKEDIVDYWEAVEILREKGFSWRDVSAWLAKRGVKIHHSQLHKHAQRIEAGAEENEE